MNFIVGPKRYDKNDALYLGEGRDRGFSRKKTLSIS